MATDPTALAEVERLVAEKERRARVARHYVAAPLHAKQLAFLARTELSVLYGGAAGGGKTEALLADALQYIDRPGYSAMIMRRTFTALNLRGSIMNRALEWIPNEFWVATAHRFVFPVPGGHSATIQFGYCDNERDLQQYQSAQFHRLYIDELTEWPEGRVSFLFSRLRRVLGDPIPIGFRAGTNPGGLGGEWVRQRYGIPEGDIVSEPIVRGRRAFVPARAEDNPSLDLESYEESLKELGAAKYEQLRWGRWVRDGEGMVYADFSSANVLTARPDWIVPGKVSALLAQDYGVTNATSFNVLVWRENDPAVYVVRSWKETGLSPSENAEKVGALNAEWKFEAMVGDVGGLGKAFAAEARKRFTLPIEPAEKQNKRGYIELFNGDLKRRRILFVEDGCGEAIHELKTLPWAENRLEEAAGFANHCTDGILYGWRRVSNYHEQEKAKRPAQGSPEALQAMADDLEARAVEQCDRELAGGWDD